MTFNGVTISGFTKISSSTLEFPSPEFTDSGSRAVTLVLTDGTTPVSKSVTVKVLEFGKTPGYTKVVYAYMSGHVDTTATGNKAPGIRQTEIMELRLADGTEPKMPYGVAGEQYPAGSSNNSATGFGH